MKVDIKDNVAVVDVNSETNSPFIMFKGTLTALNRGLKTEDGRAHAQEGDCPVENEVDAPGWAIVTTDSGVRKSVRIKSVKLMTQAMQNKHNETMAALQRLEAEKAAKAESVAKARAHCLELGLDVGTLSDQNALLVAKLVPVVPAKPAAAPEAEPAAPQA